MTWRGAYLSETCFRCEFMNFASKKECLRCRERRPKRELSPGEWECPSWVCLPSLAPICFDFGISLSSYKSINAKAFAFCRCDFFNYRRNMMCRNCNCERPRQEISAEYQEHLWESPTERWTNYFMPLFWLQVYKFSLFPIPQDVYLLNNEYSFPFTR